MIHAVIDHRGGEVRPTSRNDDQRETATVPSYLSKPTNLDEACQAIVSLEHRLSNTITELTKLKLRWDMVRMALERGLSCDEALRLISNLQPQQQKIFHGLICLEEGASIEEALQEANDFIKPGRKRRSLQASP